MRRILKRFLTRDSRGRTLASNTERLRDDGNGNLHYSHYQTATWCTGCQRPVTDLNELRGRCEFCRSRNLCSQCGEVRCQACARRLCGFCRRGFAGSTPTTVCPICLIRLHRRQAFQDRLLLQQAAFGRRRLVQSEWARLQALRLQAERLRVTGHLQAARLRLNGQMAMMREMNRLRLALANMGRHGGRHLR